jgi:phosphate starvation-inducible PhoH-like protein
VKAEKRKTRERAKPRGAPPAPEISIIEFDDNQLVKLLFGAHDRHLARIEHALGVELSPRGNRLTIRGAAPLRARAEILLRRLYTDLARGQSIDDGVIEAGLRFLDDGEGASQAVKTPRRRVTARSPAQTRYLDALDENELVIALGPAGTGKTYLAVAAGVELLMQGEVDRLILSRPAVEAGERLGFLPGDMREKVDPYLRPLYDALYDMLPMETVRQKLESQEIEVAPIAFMRGRTLAHAFIILDEAQNATPMQMKMFLTRLGERSRMVITGDPTQIDLPPGIPSGLVDAAELLEQVDGVGLVRFNERDVVRHPLVSRIVSAYNARDSARAVARPHGDGSTREGLPRGPKGREGV